MPSDLRVVFLDAATLELDGDVSFEPFTSRWSCTVHRLSTPEEVPDRIRGAQVAVTNKVVFDAALLERPEAASLKLIAVAATGTNNIDLEAARRHGLAVCNVKGYSGTSVAELTFSLMLELVGRAARYAAETKAGAWCRSPMFVGLTRSTGELAGRTLGLIGFGDIARRVARMAEACGMTVQFHARHDVPDAGTCRRVSLDDLIRTSDVLSIHCPLTPETQDLIGPVQLASMKRGALLINTARGGIVNEPALVEALRSGHLAGAGLDVLTQEPPHKTHPLMVAAREPLNLLITPHVAWATVEARRRLLKELGENIEAFERGEPRNRVV